MGSCISVLFRRLPRGFTFLLMLIKHGPIVRGPRPPRFITCSGISLTRGRNCAVQGESSCCCAPPVLSRPLAYKTNYALRKTDRACKIGDYFVYVQSSPIARRNCIGHAPDTVRVTSCPPDQRHVTCVRSTHISWARMDLRLSSYHSTPMTQ